MASAPAKINLALHVLGRRADNYHLLDTLVAFADLADRVEAEPDSSLSLAIDGPFAPDLAGAEGDNLVLAAARLLQDEAMRRGRRSPGARLRLTKNLPVAAGLGGGSSDAAAALRLLDRLWDLDLGPDRLALIGLRLGADVPMCLAGTALRARGVGEVLAEAPALPDLHLLLVNPRATVPTGAVFARLARPDNPPLPALPPAWRDVGHLVAWLERCRNDLEPPAIALVPAIADALAALKSAPGCRLARMSGSGATCFGFFANRAEAEAASARIRALAPDWWTAPTGLRR